MDRTSFVFNISRSRSERYRRKTAVSEHCVAIDVGTGSVKAALIDLQDGKVVKHAKNDICTVYSDTYCVEQRPSEWWEATKRSIASAMEDARDVKVCSVAVTGQMQDLILVDSEGEVVRDTAILYSDQRAIAESAMLTDKTGMSITPDTLLAKLQWVQTNWAKNGRYPCSTAFVGAADFIVWKLCGAHVSDPTTATTTSLSTSDGRKYNEDLFSAAGLSEWIPLLPSLQSEPVVCGELQQLVAQEIAVPALSQAPVVHAGGDAASTTFGAGAGAAGMAHLYVGTSGWIGGSVRENLASKVENSVFQLAHPFPGLVIELASMVSAGGSLAWLQRLLQISFEQMDLEAGLAEHGSNGPTFFPYLAGERCPFVDPVASASFQGLSLGTERGSLIRAVMEGVAFNLAECLSLLELSDSPVAAAVPFVGGGSRSPVWCDILASALNRTLLVPSNADLAGLRGAAGIAAIATGYLLDTTIPSSWISSERVHHPSQASLYKELRGRWRDQHPYRSSLMP